MHRPGSTTITRLWRDGEARHCRLCPSHLCHVSIHGMCSVDVEGHVPDELTTLYPLSLRRDAPRLVGLVGPRMGGPEY